MDFSQFNDAERNHLQRVMEQKQVLFRKHSTLFSFGPPSVSFAESGTRAPQSAFGTYTLVEKRDIYTVDVFVNKAPSKTYPKYPQLTAF